MCLRVFGRLCHWGPLIAIGIIKAVTYAGVICLSQWWPPQASWGGSIFFFTFMSSAVLTLYFLLQAMCIGPGSVPKGWQPENETDKKFLQYCPICENFKAPRSHHCRKCGKCVLKMDHHCPWINNCVGHRNHTCFTLFLFWAVVGCAQASYVLTACLYWAINRRWYMLYGIGDEPLIIMGLWGVVLCMFVLGLAIGVVIAVGMLLFFQLRSIMRNRTAIEDWILEKAIHRHVHTGKKFVFPYNLGRLRNFGQVINFWCEPVGDGIIWPVTKDCNQYTLTLEQLAQKEEKRARSRHYRVVELYSGRWFPVTKGLRTVCHPPCSDEPRLQLPAIGATVVATRWKTYWLYGEMQESHTTSAESQRGWFPRRCVVDVTEEIEESEEPKSYSHKTQRRNGGKKHR